MNELSDALQSGLPADQTVSPSILGALGGGLPQGDPMQALQVPQPALPEPTQDADLEGAAIDPDFGKKASDDELKEWGAESPPDWVGKSKSARMLYGLGKSIVQLAKDSAEARADRDDEIREYLKSVYMVPVERDSPIGDQGANIATSLTWEARQSLQAFILKVTTGVRPFFRTEPVNFQDCEGANKVETFYDSLLDGPVPFKPMIDTMSQKALDHGFVGLHVSWKRRKRKIREFTFLTPQVAVDMGMQPTVNGQFVDPENPGEVYTLGSVIDADRYKTVADYPEITPVSYWDFVMYPPKCYSVDEAFMVGRRLIVTVSDVNNLAKSGYLDAKAVKRLFNEDKNNTGPCPQYVDDTTRSCYLSSEDHVEGDTDGTAEITDSGAPGKANPLKSSRKVELLEVTIRVDNDGDDDDEDWIAVVETSTGTVLRVVRSPYGDTRNIRTLAVYPREDSVYGLSLPEIMNSLQQEHSLATNMMFDGVALSQTVLLTERASAKNRVGREGFTVGINQRTVDDPAKDIKLDTIPVIPATIYPSLDRIESMASKTTAVNETMMGVTGASTTATQSTQAMTAGVRRLEVLVMRVQGVLHEVMNLVHKVTTAYEMASVGDPAKPCVWVKGDGIPDALPVDLTLSDILIPMKFIPHGDLKNTDEDLRLQSAEKLFMMAQNSPFMGGSMERLYAVQRYVIGAYGVQNIQDFLGTMAEAQKMDKDKAENPGPEIPPFEKADPEWLANYLAMNPDQADGVITMLQRISEAQAAGQVKAAEIKAQVDMQANEQELGLKQQEMEMNLEHQAQKNQLDLQKMQASTENQLVQNEIKNQSAQQSAEQQKQSGEAKLELQKKQAAMKPKPTVPRAGNK